jgi:hypothetical protein
MSLAVDPAAQIGKPHPRAAEATVIGLLDIEARLKRHALERHANCLASFLSRIAHAQRSMSWRIWTSSAVLLLFVAMAFASCCPVSRNRRITWRKALLCVHERTLRIELERRARAEANAGGTQRGERSSSWCGAIATAPRSRAWSGAGHCAGVISSRSDAAAVPTVGFGTRRCYSAMILNSVVRSSSAICTRASRSRGQPSTKTSALSRSPGSGWVKLCVANRALDALSITSSTRARDLGHYLQQRIGFD